MLRFTGCANVGLALDADVLGLNSPSNTAALDATADRAQIESIMRHQKQGKLADARRASAS